MISDYINDAILLNNRNVENYIDYNIENNISNHNSYTNKENFDYNLNSNINKEYFKEIKKPIIINSRSFMYDNYGYNKYHGLNIKGVKNDEFIFKNKTINNCSKRYKNIIRNNKNQIKDYKNIRKKL